MSRRVFRIAFLLIPACLAAFGSTLVVPGNQAASPGNTPIKVGAIATHFQEIVGSGQFNNALAITGIRLRSAVGTGPVSVSYASFKITLSTTKAYPNTANGHTLPSTTYANIRSLTRPASGGRRNVRPNGGGDREL